ncbi:GNAT family N-acetyltransferase [Aureibacillus halotolerans]|uniref:Acetyltransferase (GNAT) family protein n=1 Tax=Aureibacillus halotolerans TaxID=1508390 RepID=A0A4R6UDA2_9BACI|nr:GNAT family N-acetyltransferase [Aureibacillus halotolerans]TDQ41084.1 acetyltransferase (GNAT) family protein [Aureibacillus halotolerans]
MEVTYEINGNVEAGELSRVYASSGMKRPVDDPERLARMLANANLVVSARINGELIGVARCLTDFSYSCFVSCLAVSKEAQGKGVGRQLLEHVKQAVGEEAAVDLYSTPIAMTYYPHLGFDTMDNAFRLPRKK